MYEAKAYSAASATLPLGPNTITRREPGENDVQIEILYCGICHSDLHQVRDEWSGVMPTIYPCVPGHEIVGRVTKAGSAVSRFKPGGIAETREMLDFRGRHNIAAEVEVIPIQKVNEAYGRLLQSDVKYRFSIDMASLKSESSDE